MTGMSLEMRSIVIDSFTNVSQRVAGFAIKYAEKETKLSDVRKIKIETVGFLKASLVFSMEPSYEQAILKGMTKEKTVSPEIALLYIGEYVNVLSGQVLTKVNNFVGKPSRLTVPVVGLEKSEKLTLYACQEELIFSSEYGCMKVQISYEF